MLVLSRRVDESITIGDDIVVTVLAFRGNKVRLGVTCPCQIPVDREEIRRAKKREQDGRDQARRDDPDATAPPQHGGPKR